MNINKNKFRKIFINKSKLIDSNVYPKISIITVVKNGQKYLEKTIKSIINQKYKNFEYIIIDGYSSDNTQSIINKYQKSIHLYLKSNDKNLWEAMNLGIKVSSGSIIVFLNSDDIFYPKALNYAANYFKKNKKLDFLFGAVHKHWLKFGFFPKKAFWTFNFYTTHSIGFFIKKKIHKEIGFYDEQILSSDLDLFLRIIFRKKFIGESSKKSQIFGYFRPGGFSSKVKYREHLKDLNKIRIKNNQNKLFVYLIYLFKILKKPKKFFLNKH